MSSLMRRIEKRIMKKGGYSRELFKFVKGVDGKPRVVPVRRGGLITDQHDDPAGYHWPARIPAAIKGSTKPTKIRRPTLLNGKMVGRGRRRGKHSKAWIESRQLLVLP